MKLRDLLFYGKGPMTAYIIKDWLHKPPVWTVRNMSELKEGDIVYFEDVRGRRLLGRYGTLTFIIDKIRLSYGNMELRSCSTIG